MIPQDSVYTTDGFRHEARSELQNQGTPDEALVVTGSSSYIGSDGMLIILVFHFSSNVHTRPEFSNPSIILKYDFQLTDTEGYYFSVLTSDGFSHEARGELQDQDTPEEALAVKGSYSYIGPNRVKYTVDYVANKDGFQPKFRQSLLPYLTPVPVSIPVLVSLSGTGLG
ncbi:hypothetical protein NQ317_000968 [Molorchus minor]|uniref:Uncharacterized protein n=1 Tax=Molorchus minor TaxID=1323400 RepID=A0ABQ9IW17_9CUCU|nr:hypothetical protein NQ317_000968 [Molorchus minor]